MFDEIMDKIIEESGLVKELLRRSRLDVRRDDIIAITAHRFPQLQQAMREHLGESYDESFLHDLLIHVASVPDETTARTALGLPQP